MKKLILSALIAITAVFAGCKTATVESMEQLGFTAGYTAAYVLNKQAKIDNPARQAIINVMTVVQTVTPATNETYSTKWSEVAKVELQKLVDAGKIPQQSADYISRDIGKLGGLLDKYIEKKGIKDKKDLVDAFVGSFCSSFLTYFKPANVVSADSEKKELDEFTNEYLTENLK